MKGLVTIALLLSLMPGTADRRAEVVAIGQAIEDQDQYDPWSLAALAVKESRARLDVIGKRGECGAFQVMGWFLKPAMTCEELQTPQGSVTGAVRALAQWQAWHEEHSSALPWYAAGANFWHCYAAGEHCYAPDAIKRQEAIRYELLEIAGLFAIDAADELLTMRQ